MYNLKKRKSEAVKELERETKHVRFTTDIKEDSSNFKSSPPKALPPKANQHIKSFKKIWYKFAYEKRFEELKQTLDNYQKRRNLADFFKSQGEPILDLALFRTLDADQFNFICENLSPELIQATLSKENYSLVNRFLEEEPELTTMDNKYLMNRLKKIKLLARILPETIKERLATSAYNISTSINKSIKASIAQAQLKKEETILTLPPLILEYPEESPTPPLGEEKTTLPSTSFPSLILEYPEESPTPPLPSTLPLAKEEFTPPATPSLTFASKHAKETPAPPLGSKTTTLPIYRFK